MRFWDSSALVPLIADEAKTEILNQHMATDRLLLVSFITPIEVEGAVWRKVRHMRDEVARQRCQQRLASLRNDWNVVEEFLPALTEAHRMIARYGLRGADAIQLGCAIVANPPRGIPFVTLDEELAAAARAEGFPILP